MKKILFSLVLCTLLCSLLAFGAEGAAKGKMSLSGTVTDLKQGDLMALTVELNRNPGVQTLRCTVGFDPKVLDFVAAEGTGILPNFSFEEDVDKVLLRWNGYEDMTKTGEVAKITLRVKEDAIYGDSAVTLTVSSQLYDAQNAAGDAVAFETSALKFLLPCPHKSTESSVEQEATFEAEGIVKETCTDCGNTTMRPLLPSVKSCDGRVEAQISVGEFSAADVVEVKAEDLYNTEEQALARDLLGEDLYFCFRIRFTKNGEAYSPARDCTIRLTSDHTLPKGTVLYALMDGGSVQTSLGQVNNTISFAYDDVVFALVARTHQEPVIPTTTTTTATTTTSPAKTLDPIEKERQRDLLLIAIGVATLFVCGTGMILILGKRKRY